MARRRAKYQFLGAAKKGCGCVSWCVGLLLLAVVGWILWETYKGGKPLDKTKVIVTSQGQGVQKMVRAEPPPSAVQTNSNTNAISPPRAVPHPNVVTNLVPMPPPLVATNAVVVPPGVYPRPVQTLFEAQVALARLAISPGSLDGLAGSQTRSALRAFQAKEHIPATGELDETTKGRLALMSPVYTEYTVTSNDLARLQPIKSTWLGKSQQSALDYETILELVGEKGRAYPSLIRRLNPAINWTNVPVGTVVQLPDVSDPEADSKAAFVKISLGGKVLEAFDTKTNLLAHFPCSIAQRVEKRPIGELHVAVIVPNPNYTFDPEVFPESEEGRRLKTKLVVPPGPNNPVGVAWIGLDKPGYGMHGTPNPEQVGRTESHGCFRLANWNAEYLIKLVWIGMPVYVGP